MKLILSFAFTAALVCVAAMPASANVYDWTTWTSGTPGTPGGSAAGTAGTVGVTYQGDLISLVANYPSWTPTSSYIGGPVGNAPPASGGILQLFGGNTDVDTITFSAPVTDPALAIWSLGQGGLAASFDFSANPNFTIVAGGPSAEYGGGSIYLCNTASVCGTEGNGTVVFSGTYTSISWENPGFEDWYGVTAGVAATPEPGFYALLGLGLSGLAVVRRKLSKNS
jgi:hypothetical protein